MNIRKSLLGFAIVSGLFGGAMAACGDDGATIGAPTPDGGTATDTGSSPPTGNSDSAPPADQDGGTTDDGSSSDDAGDIPVTDGGDNIDPDGGELDDAGDAGPCNAIVNAAPAIDSDCISKAPIWGGGPLVAGTYHLTAVRLLAPVTFCAATFMKTSFKETLELTVDANGIGTANTITKIGANGPERTRTVTLDPAAMNKSPLVATFTCPPRKGGDDVYFSGQLVNKQTLVLREEYGNNAQADFHFEKQ